MICRSCGRDVGTETCSDCYGDPFEKNRVKLDSGVVRFVGLRCVQVVVYSSVIFNWVGVKPGFWSIFLPVFCGAIYGVFDYVKVIPQEMRFIYDKNPRFRRLEEKIDEIKNRLV